MKPVMLITGGAGLLATNWAMQMRHSHEITLGLHSRVIEIPGVHAERICLDSEGTVLSTLDRIDANIVVHTAAMTSVESCEVDPVLALNINAEITSNVAIACARRGVKLIYISTDHLFNGKTPLNSESASICPVNAYGKTKAEAEKRVLDACPDALVLRTNFFGWGPIYRKSFSDLIIESLRKKQQIRLFSDAFFTPIIMSSLIQAAHELCEINASGILNLVGDERLSKHEFGVRLAKAFGLDIRNILKTQLADRTDLVKRPLDLSLSNKKVCGLLGRPLGDANTHIAQLVASDPSYASICRNSK